VTTAAVVVVTSAVAAGRKRKLEEIEEGTREKREANGSVATQAANFKVNPNANGGSMGRTLGWKRTRRSFE